MTDIRFPSQFWIIAIIPSALLGIFNVWFLWDVNPFLAMIIGDAVFVISTITLILAFYCSYLESLKRDEKNKIKLLTNLLLYSQRFRRFVLDYKMQK